ncbi:phosphate signaling complex protein PhoU [Nisaea sp.]|jgi:phosphate transport system protein|uniref:phosphate signaling complex protein PhoU n=1 Tax=Nisaea sp. TaxID=2024842 RepID=UPI002B26F01F|nr:phosphate signaling complex protein PhoU [Nisaea sp.]
MGSNNDHIVSSFDEELGALKAKIAQMGGLVESQCEAAVRAVHRRDQALAQRVREADAPIDLLETEVEAMSLRLLALRQPLGGDLRTVVASLKIVSDLERIGDYAANIGKRAIVLSSLPEIPPANGIVRIGSLVQSLIKDVLDAYADDNLDLAVAAWHRDEDIDELYTSLFRELLTYMMEDPRNISASTHLLFIAKNLERMGDHATNIAETVHFQIKGTKMQADRPKGEDASYVVTMPE